VSVILEAMICSEEPKAKLFLGQRCTIAGRELGTTLSRSANRAAVLQSEVFLGE
jgi:hypothetical protein